MKPSTFLTLCRPSSEVRAALPLKLRFTSAVFIWPSAEMSTKPELPLMLMWSSTYKSPLSPSSEVSVVVPVIKNSPLMTRRCSSPTRLFRSGLARLKSFPITSHSSEASASTSAWVCNSTLGVSVSQSLKQRSRATASKHSYPGSQLMHSVSCESPPLPPSGSPPLPLPPEFSASPPEPWRPPEASLFAPPELWSFPPVPGSASPPEPSSGPSSSDAWPPQASTPSTKHATPPATSLIMVGQLTEIALERPLRPEGTSVRPSCTVRQDRKTTLNRKSSRWADQRPELAT